MVMLHFLTFAVQGLQHSWELAVCDLEMKQKLYQIEKKKKKKEKRTIIFRPPNHLK